MSQDVLTMDELNRAADRLRLNGKRMWFAPFAVFVAVCFMTWYGRRGLEMPGAVTYIYLAVATAALLAGSIFGGKNQKESARHLIQYAPQMVDIEGGRARFVRQLEVLRKGHRTMVIVQAFVVMALAAAAISDYNVRGDILSDPDGVYSYPPGWQIAFIAAMGLVSLLQAYPPRPDTIRSLSSDKEVI